MSLQRNIAAEYDFFNGLLVFFESGDELVRVERFFQISVESKLVRLLADRAAAKARHEHRAHVRMERFRRMDEIEPRSAGKVEAGDEGIEELATNELQRTLKLRDRDDIEPGVFEENRQRSPHRGVVFNDENTSWVGHCFVLKQDTYQSGPKM